MERETILELRDSLEIQFRQKLYNDIMFPYLHSLGILDILQSFDYNNEYIGTLHLFYRKKENDYIWESKWIDREVDAIYTAQIIQEQKIYNENLLVLTNLNFIRSKYEPNLFVQPHQLN
jgi:outer membrane protein assembly factor BamB